MKILAVDTALGACSAAIINDARVLAREHEQMQRGHAEALAPMVKRIMEKGECAFPELDRIAVTTGPGTFTGQRVGLAFARALGLALKKPVIGITTLDAMAAEALSGNDSAAWAIAAADAKRGEIYLGARSRNETILPPMLIALDHASLELALFADRFGPDAVVSGTAAEMLIAMPQWITFTDSGVRQPDAVWVARLALSAPEGPPPKPLYLRPPDAKLPETSP